MSYDPKRDKELKALRDKIERLEAEIKGLKTGAPVRVTRLDEVDSEMLR